MNKSPFSLITLFAIAFIVYQALNFARLSSINYFSLTSEAIITTAILFLMANLQNLRSNKSIYQYLILGFSLLFISLLTDTLDEIFVQPEWLATVFEDFCKTLGFIILLMGIRNWIKLNNEHNEALINLASTDELTKLFTRRYFHEKAIHEFNMYKRTKNHFAILMIDIDHFKDVNDRYGHSGGDIVLQKFSDQIKNSIRKTDTIARWGGEEFIVLLVGIDNETCSLLAEKIRQQFEDLEINIGDQEVKITVSIGATISREKDDSIDVIINRADKLLYHAKQKGRNCIIQDYSKQNGSVQIDDQTGEQA